AGAFAVAALVCFPYTQVMIAALVPALLLYISAFFSVHWKSAALGYKPIEKEAIPTVQETFIPANVLITVIPVSILIYFLFGGSSAARAGFYATVACLVLYIFKDLKPVSIKDRVLDIGNMFVEAGTGLIMIAILAGTAQIIVGLLSITGLGIKLSNVLLSVGDGSVIITLVLAMLICIILGMGMPTTAAYLLASSTLASTLVTLGHEARSEEHTS